jgi:hypothetical protein
VSKKDKAGDPKAGDKDAQAKAIREETEGQTAPATKLPTEEQDLAADSIQHDRGVKEAQERQAEAGPGSAEPPEAEGGEGNPEPQRGPKASMGADGPDPEKRGGSGADGPDPAPRVKLSAFQSLREHLEGIVRKAEQIHDRIDDRDLQGRLRQAHGAADNLLDAIRGVMGKRGVSAPVPSGGEGQPEEGQSEEGGAEDEAEEGAQDPHPTQLPA